MSSMSAAILVPTVAAMSGSSQNNLAALQSMSMPRLKAMARQRGLRPSENKSELVQALVSTDKNSNGAAFKRAAAGTLALSPDTSGLEGMTLGELRAMAKNRGMRGDTKAELIKLLSGLPTPSAAAASYSTPSSSSSSSSSSSTPPMTRITLLAKSLPQLKMLAAQRGIRAGNTKNDLITALLSGSTGAAAPAPSYSSSSSSSSYTNGAASASAVSSGALDGMTLGELRALAKERGLRGDTKAELIKLLSGAAPAPASRSSYSAPSYSSPSSSGSSQDKAAMVRHLKTKSLPELRAMALARGIRAIQKKEDIIAALSA